MLKIFKDKIEEISEKRADEWRIIRPERSMMETELYKKEKELDSFLEELGIKEDGRGNGFDALYWRKDEELKRRYPSYISRGIDDALECKKKQKIASWELLGEVEGYLESGIGEIEIQAAFMLVTLIVSNMNQASYKECLSYKETLGKAFSKLLENESYHDMVYAQWGKLLYETVMFKALREDKGAYKQEYFEAYEKFQQIEKQMPEVALYRGYSRAGSELEFSLIELAKTNKYPDPEGVVWNLLLQKSGTERMIIRKYRFEVLEKAIVQMAEAEMSIETLKEEIIQKADTFENDVKRIIERYNSIIKEKKKVKYTSIVKKYICDKKYVEQIPMQYRELDLTDFIKKYEKFLIGALMQDKNNPSAVESQIREATEDFIASYTDNFETEYEKKIRAEAEADYVQKMLGKLETVTEVPKCVPRNMNVNVETCKKILKEYCLDKSILQEVGTEAWKNKWTDGVPYREVTRHFEDALDELKKRVMLAAESKPVVKVTKEEPVKTVAVVKKEKAQTVANAGRKKVTAKEYKLPMGALIVFSIFGMNMILFQKVKWLFLMFALPLAIYFAKRNRDSLLKYGVAETIGKSYLIKHVFVQMVVTTFWTFLTSCLLRDFSDLIQGIAFNAIISCVYVWALGLRKHK